MKLLLILSLSLTLAACGGSSSDSNDTNNSDSAVNTNSSSDSTNSTNPNSNTATNPTTPNPNAYTPTITSLSQMRLVDAQGAPLSNVDVSIFPKETSMPTGIVINNTEFSNLTTDAEGNLTLNNLQPGAYTLKITVQGVSVISEIIIDDNNASTSTTVAAPVIVDGTHVDVLQDEDGQNTGIFASISGVVFTANGPLSGAEISLSGGAETNGAVATDVTDENGHYLLIINVSLDKLSAMQQAKLRIIKDGHFNIEKTFDPTSALAFIGQNFQLSVASSSGSVAVYKDDFNTPLSDATCGGWTSVDLSPSTINLWHHHTNGLNITNQALVQNLVKLAPDDNSAGMVPNPFDGGACWYGQPESGESGSVAQGNFLGSPADGTGGDEFDGGTSVDSHSGALESPPIDLSSATAPLALSFRTWWEIESVNPNEDGYDLLMVEYSLDGGNHWVNLARLNPFTDPVTGEGFNRAAVPFTNRGFNRAPAWLWQEPIDISVLAGHSNAKLRFVFNTEDELYNGFRGWLIDDVRITKEQGTFPLYDGSFEDECWDEENFEDLCNDDGNDGGGSGLPM